MSCHILYTFLSDKKMCLNFHKEGTNTQVKITSENKFTEEIRSYNNHEIFIGIVKKENDISQMFMRIYNQHIRTNSWENDCCW